MESVAFLALSQSPLKLTASRLHGFLKRLYAQGAAYQRPSRWIHYLKTHSSRNSLAHSHKRLHNNLQIFRRIPKLSNISRYEALCSLLLFYYFQKSKATLKKLTEVLSVNGNLIRSQSFSATSFIWIRLLVLKKSWALPELSRRTEKRFHGVSQSFTEGWESRLLV